MRKAFGLEILPWKNMPDDLILLAQLQKSSKISNSLRNDLETKYGFTYEQPLEFLGDRIIELISVQVAFALGKRGIHSLDFMRKQLTKNATLFCLMQSQDLCRFVEHSHTKQCSNLFEAIIGAMYFYLFSILKDRESFSIITNYVMEKFWKQEAINYAVNNDPKLTSCNKSWKKSKELTELDKSIELDKPSKTSCKIKDRVIVSTILALEEKKNLELITLDELMTAIKSHVEKISKSPCEITEETKEKRIKPLLEGIQSGSINWRFYLD